MSELLFFVFLVVVVAFFLPSPTAWQLASMLFDDFSLPRLESVSVPLRAGFVICFFVGQSNGSKHKQPNKQTKKHTHTHKNCARLLCNDCKPALQNAKGGTLFLFSLFPPG